MKQEIEIDIISTERRETGGEQLPLNFLSFGEIENDDVKVYIKQDVYKALEKYASSDTARELGTILIGDYCEDMGKTHVVISDYIEAKYTDASASTLTFTHETWEYVHKQHDAKYSDKKIIGWQHTHPNYGIFLSNYDLFIQENFFNLPFQIAYVIDPIQNMRGFFQWKNGKIEKLKGYYVYDDIGKPIKIEQKKVEREGRGKTDKRITALVSLLCVVTLGLGAFSFIINHKYNEQVKLQKAMAEQLELQEQSIYGLQNQLIDSILDTTGITTAQDFIRKIENDEIVLMNKEAVLKQLNDLVGTSLGEKAIRFVSYTIKEGDSLLEICDEYDLDYQANLGIILSLNGITDPDALYAGQAIILPIQ